MGQSTRRHWRQPLDREKSALATKFALNVANRLRKPADVEATVLEAAVQSNQPTGPHWTAHGFAQGYAGLSLLWGHLDRCFPGEGWDAIAHEHLEIAAQGASTQKDLMPGAFGGLSGLAFAAHYLSRSGSRYQQLMATLDRNISQKLKPMTADLLSARSGVPVSIFDVISGVSGIGLYLLSRAESHGAKSALLDVVRCLVALSQEENGLPRWHSPSHLSSNSDFMLQQFPDGYANCGLAHGIPGPLGVLALARLAGVDCEGLHDAIERLASWLIAHRLDDGWGINWPTGIGLVPMGNDQPIRLGAVNESPRAQAGWCYGSPGVARVLYFAGLALQKEEYCQLAIQAIEAVLQRPWPARRIESPTFCHGVAGLLQIVLRFANETGSPTLQAGAADLTEHLLNLYEPASLLGFRSIELAGKRVDQPGLLDGAPGVALVLLGAARDVEPAWDRIFLLS